MVSLYLIMIIKRNKLFLLLSISMIPYYWIFQIPSLVAIMIFAIPYTLYVPGYIFASLKYIELKEKEKLSDLIYFA